MNYLEWMGSEIVRDEMTKEYQEAIEKLTEENRKIIQHYVDQLLREMREAERREEQRYLERKNESMRDTFAMNALNALVSNPSVYPDISNPDSYNIQSMVKGAYEFADVMISQKDS